MGCLSLVNVHSEERYALPGVGIHLPRDAGMCVWCHNKKRELVTDPHYWSEPKEKIRNSNDSQEHEISG